MDAKELLLKQLGDVYSGDDEMSLETLLLIAAAVLAALFIVVLFITNRRPRTVPSDAAPYECPICGAGIFLSNDACPSCGTVIDWGEEDGW